MHTNIVDFIIISIISIGAINGYRHGLIESLGRMVSALLAIGIAIFWRNDFINFLNYKFNIICKLTEVLKQQIAVEALVEKNYFLSFILNQEDILDPIQLLTCFIFQPLTFIVLFLMAYFCFLFFFKMLNYAVSGGILGSFNRILGMAVAILQTLFLFTIIAGLAMPPLEFAARLDIIGAVEIINYMRDSLLIKYMLGFFENLNSIINKYA